MEKFLGRGASASVWEAFRSDNHQRVAVKVGSAETVGPSHGSFSFLEFSLPILRPRFV